MGPGCVVACVGAARRVGVTCVEVCGVGVGVGLEVMVCGCGCGWCAWDCVGLCATVCDCVRLCATVCECEVGV